jgi:hypothetical protein
MKKITMLIAVLAMVGSNSAFAQNNNMGKGAAASTNTGSSNGYMSWLVGLGSLAVLGTVVGLSAASASSSPSTFGH